MEMFILSIYLLSFLFYFLACFLRPKFFPKVALFFLILGFSGNIYLIIQYFLHTHRLPLTTMSETLLSAITIIVLIFLVLELKKHQLEITGLFVSLISFLGLMAAFWFFKRPLMPLLPALQSKWLPFHVSSCIIAYCLFTISFIAAITYLTHSSALKLCLLGQGRRHRPGMIKEDAELNKEILLNRLCHRCICPGFFLLTLGIILGSIWGKSAWGHWWNWDPKEVWALITWLIYASYMHGRLFGDWSEKKLSYVAILGFLSCLFTYLGVNFLLSGLHSYA